MDKIGLVELSNLEFECLVLATSYRNPFEDLALIEFKLKEKNCSGNILFDMLGYTGDNSERFLTCEFDGEKLKRDTFKIICLSKKSIFRKMTNEYFMSYKELLDGTVLSSLQKKVMIDGINI